VGCNINLAFAVHISLRQSSGQAASARTAVPRPFTLSLSKGSSDLDANRLLQSTSEFSERPTTLHSAKVDIAKLVRVTVEIFRDLGIDGHEFEFAVMHLWNQRLDVVPSR